MLCERGVNGRLSKSVAVLEAGGVGMILANTSANSLNADLHFVPSVHISHLDLPPVRAYAATAGATARMNQGTGRVHDTGSVYRGILLARTESRIC